MYIAVVNERLVAVGESCKEVEAKVRAVDPTRYPPCSCDA